MIDQNEVDKQNASKQQIPQENSQKSQLKQQDDEKIHHDFISKQKNVEKLQVQIFPKQNLQNPQKVQKNDIQIHNITDPYGPFNKTGQNQSILLKNVNQNLNYEIQISPVLTNLSQRKENLLKDSFKGKISKNKRSSNILTQESTHQLQFSKADQAQLEKQILALAKNIRQKVKRKQQKKQKSPDIVSPIQHLTKKVQNKATDVKIKKLYQKRHSIFQKYSYPRSVGIDISQLQKEEARLKVGKYTIERVYNEEQIQESMLNAEIESEQLQSSVKVQNRSQSKTQSQKARNVVQLPKLKLNFDKTHHKYQMTEFRKNILKQKKQRQMAKSLMIKEKQDTLQKRRQIYNTSRYHPVGIKLSSLRTSRIPNAEVNLKDNLVSTTERLKILEQQRDFSLLSLQTPQKQTSILSQGNQNQKKIERSNIVAQMYSNIKTPQKPSNPSQIKSSLTFNFSFSDPINLNSEVRTQSQIINDVSNLAKELQNDSDLKEKLQRVKNYTLNEAKNEKFQHKKWTSIDKHMTQSKHIQQVVGLHNSSAQQYDQEQNYNDIQLQYSYI